jgi:hypothetical protein
MQTAIYLFIGLVTVSFGLFLLLFVAYWVSEWWEHIDRFHAQDEVLIFGILFLVLGCLVVPLAHLGKYILNLF